MFSGLNTFTLTDYGLLSPCLRFTHTVTRIDAKLGSDGRLTLSGWLFNQLDFPGFAWRTKNSLSMRLKISKGELCETFAKGSIDPDKKSISGRLNIKKRVWSVNGKTKFAPPVFIRATSPGRKNPGIRINKTMVFQWVRRPLREPWTGLSKK